GWKHTEGLRIHGGRIAPFVLPWPELADYPNFGMVCRRTVLDERLARHAESQGVALVEGVNVTDPILDPSGRIRGVRTSDGTEYSAPVVVAADGNSSRLGLAMGLHKRDDRPMGVAVRAYYRSALSESRNLESWLE
ncbi:NAD(P)/FAD-dependent oxidoreductase, partial [Klebsiella pneumoniae]|uniref:NAD(P)/FAD-dependent oxidoreductase n=1 Tax=Klebsiella pneumoniae TaxID=573 RepID=UPI002175029D